MKYAIDNTVSSPIPWGDWENMQEDLVQSDAHKAFIRPFNDAIVAIRTLEWMVGKPLDKCVDSLCDGIGTKVLTSEES